MTNQEIRENWENLGPFWDAKMGEGNLLFDEVIWPETVEMLEIFPNMKILDIACGNGLTCRRLSAKGAQVVGVDFSSEMLRAAIQRSSPSDNIQYINLDVTDYNAMLELGAATFDSAICNMAFMDISELRNLHLGVAKLLKPNGNFVVSILHPAFSGPTVVRTAAMQGRGAKSSTNFSLSISRYLTSESFLEYGLPDQPTPHTYFHRSIATLLSPAFEAGFILNCLKEPQVSIIQSKRESPLHWGRNLQEFPPFLLFRLSKP